MAIKTRQDQFGVDIKAETTEIFETSRLVSKLTGYPVNFETNLEVSKISVVSAFIFTPN